MPATRSRIATTGVLVALLVGDVHCAAHRSAPEDSSGALGMRLEFVCVWWSESQMNGLDPDNPPPKRTSVSLDRWEYTDPVGVPHPDTFDVVATVTADPHSGGAVRLAAAQRWLIGPIGDRDRATWSEWSALPVVEAAVDRNGSGVLRVATIDLAQRQSMLYADDMWPWMYEVRATARAGRSAVATGRTLPIHPGD